MEFSLKYPKYFNMKIERKIYKATAATHLYFTVGHIYDKLFKRFLEFFRKRSILLICTNMSFQQENKWKKERIGRAVANDSFTIPYNVGWEMRQKCYNDVKEIY